MCPLKLPAGRVDGARMLKQLLETAIVAQNPKYMPQIATTVSGGFGGEGAALANANSAGAARVMLLLWDVHFACGKLTKV